MEQVKIFRWRQPYGDHSVGAGSGENQASWERFQDLVNEWLAEQRPQITRTAHADHDHGHSVAIYYTVDTTTTQDKGK